MNAGLGFSLVAIGLLLFASGLNKTTGAMLAGLFYGIDALGNPSTKATNPVSDSPYISDADKKASQGQSGIIGVTPSGKVPGLFVPNLDPSKNS